jgi:hypothetical protein
MKTSIVALVAATFALSAPALAQDASVGVSTEVSAEVPSIETSVSAEAGGSTSTDATASASAEGGADVNFDIDANIDLDITAEQTVEIRKLIVDANVQPVTVDFDVSIGATIPASVTLTPLPAGIVALNAGLEGYLFFVLADGRIVVVSPTTLKVVLIIRA